MKQCLSCEIFPSLYWIIFLIICEILPIVGNRCSLHNGECTYNIQLNSVNGDCSSSPPTSENSIFWGSGNVIAQNDNQKGASPLEQEVHTVKTNHEDRIRELEASVQKLLRDAVPPGPRNMMTEAPSGSIGRRNTNRTENNLLTRLADEFSGLRNNLRTKTLSLLDAQAKLNETTETLNVANEQLFETSEQLILAEHRAATLQQENYILKNQLKDKTLKLKFAEDSLNISETKLRETEQQLYVLVRSEANLKEELGYYKYKLNKTERKLDNLKHNHTRLWHQFNRTMRTLRRTEMELMDCYSAKTQTFCGFEDEQLCNFVQENTTDDFDWTLARIKTPSAGTGPTGDHTCGPGSVGRFMYIESSAKKPDMRAVLKSVRYRGLQRQCANFYYHMYGRHVGTLNVYTKTDSSEDALSTWRTYGDQGDVWIKASLSIPRALARVGYQIIFEGITGRGYQGDIAIDDISVQDGPCGTGGVVIPVRFNPSSLRPAESNSTEGDSDQMNMRRYRKLRRMFRNRLRRRNNNNNVNTSNINITTS